MQSRTQASFARAAAVLCAALMAAGAAQAQAKTAQSTVTGTVTKIDESAKTIGLKTDAGQELSVTMGPRVSFRRVAPGETDLRKAENIQFSDIAVGDRVLARGGMENQTITATLIVSMTKGAIAKMQEAERADWDKRGVAGLVTAVDADSVTISVRTLAGTKQLVIAPAANAIVRRYAPDSINFVDAKPSKLSEIKVGDQVRARGDKSEDGGKMSAVEIVSGTFKTMAGVILSIDAANNQMQVRDLDTKMRITVKVNHDSSLHKVPPQEAQIIAARLHPREQAEGDDQGGGRGRGGFGRGEGRGRGFGGGAGRGGDVQQMLDSSPMITLADLKVGDAIVVSSTVGASADSITAIKLLAGVEPILTKPGTQEMSLGSWNPGGGGGEGGGDLGGIGAP